MKTSLTALTTCLFLCTQALAATADKPNILVIYAADPEAGAVVTAPSVRQRTRRPVESCVRWRTVGPSPPA